MTPNSSPEPSGRASFVRVTAASHPTAVADPMTNAQHAIDALQQLGASQVVVFGELSLTGYSCGDLFAQDQLLTSAQQALKTVCDATKSSQQLVVVGLPLRVQSSLFNAAAALCSGRLLGLVPKQFLPNYEEFYEARWFSAADGTETPLVELPGWGEVPFGTDLLFEHHQLTVGIELCEDLWMPLPPSSYQAAAGANLILNLSASNELIGKAGWRRTLVQSQSGRCLAAYAYASAGPSESTTDLVFGGHCLVAENGILLSESERIGAAGCGWIEHTHATADVDLQRLSHDRQITGSWQQAVKRSQLPFRRIPVPLEGLSDGKCRTVSGAPFVPKDGPELHARCAEIFGIQCAGLAKRVSRLPESTPLNIGVSGGLDSTLSLLVAVKTCQMHDWPAARIQAFTMPGFGTSERTRNAANALMKLLGVTPGEIDIQGLCLDVFQSMNHQPFGIEVDGLNVEQFVAQLQQIPRSELHDLVFENVQARMRTMLLMNHGFVLGTGDLSEQALGWSTYNGDHMSMYNVNASIPKTLVRFLVSYVAEHEFAGRARDQLLEIVKLPISPELLPSSQDGEIDQLTEETLGPYELHDFFLYHMIRFGAAPDRILHLASLAEFSRQYSSQEIKATLRIFVKRFFQNQFKRSCVPDGPKVGSVSLSPRGDWRMPSDAEYSAWMEMLKE